MNAIEDQVARARRRLWLNRWIGQWGWSLTLATGVWLSAWIADRLFSLHWPMGAAALAGLGLSLAASVVWLMLTRDSAHHAAAALDSAAGLRERVATSLNVRADSADPFETAVVCDAERAVTGLTPRKFLPVRWSGSLSITGAMLVIALLSLLLPEFDLLNRDEAAAQAQDVAARQSRVQNALSKPISVLKKVAEQNPDLSMEENVDRSSDPLDGRRKDDPSFTRRETLKQIDRLRDALDKKADAEKFRINRETKKRLRQIGEPSDPKSELTELMSHLAEGEFAEAEQEAKKLAENLAKRAREGKLKPEQMQALEKQLEELQKKLEKAAENKKQEAQLNKQCQQQLQNSGLSKKEAERVLDALAKKDPKQLEQMAKDLAKRLKDQGVTKEQMKEMLQKMQKQMQQQKASSKQCQNMAQKMGQCAKAMEQGDAKQAGKKLEEAGDMLNEMEQLEQALNELESQMSDLEDAKDDLEEYDPDNDDLACDMCHGSGFLPDGSPCPKCNPNGDRKGNGRGRGAGARDRDDSAKTSTVNEKAKTKRGVGGSIVAQQFVKGKQLKGESRVDFSDAIGAHEIDTADALNRDRIPRRYRKGVKRFFDRLGSDFDKSAPDDDAKDRPEAGDDAKDKPTATGGDAKKSSGDEKTGGGGEQGEKKDSAGPAS